jgi:hypothetical protein
MYGRLGLPFGREARKPMHSINDDSAVATAAS